MKKNVCLSILAMLLCVALLTGCAGGQAEGDMTFDGQKPAEETVEIVSETTDVPAEPVAQETAAPAEATDAPADEPEVTYAEALYAAMEATGALKDMARYSNTDLLDYYGIDSAVCSCVAGYVNAAGLADEIVIAVANDEAAAEQIETLLSGHLDAKLKQYEGYDATGFATLQKAELHREGKTVVLIVSPDATALYDVYLNFTF